MSVEDAERIGEAFATLKRDGYEALLPETHPDFEMTTSPGLAAEPQTYRGPEGIRRWWESFYEVMDDVTLEPRAVHDAGDGTVIVECDLIARGRTSGIEVSQSTCLLCRLKDGLLLGIEFFDTVEDAREAARGET